MSDSTPLTAAEGRDWMFRCIEVSERLVKVRKERDVLAAIARDLAATDARYVTTDGIACGLCGAEFPAGSGTPSYVDNHPDHCPLRRACEWAEAQGSQGDDDAPR